MKKLIAAFLAICTMLTTLPLQAFATDSESVNSQIASMLQVHDSQAVRKEAVSLALNDTIKTIGNGYLEYTVDNMSEGVNSGRFTVGNTGGNPNYASDNNKKLLFGHPDPWSSYTTIRISNTDYIFRASETEYDEANLRAISRMTVDQVEITQTLQIVNNGGTGLSDTVQIGYTAKNLSSTPKSIGIRIMLDTMLGDNDGAPFKVPSVGNVTYEKELVGNAIPQFWQAFDSLDNATVFAVGTLYKENERKPDKVQFASWSGIYDSSNCWNYAVHSDTPVTGDSAVAVYWNPKSVASNQTLDVSTYYGVGYADNGTAAANPAIDIPSNGYAVVVQDENGKPIKDAEVVVNYQNTNATLPTEADGAARFSSVPITIAGKATHIRVAKENYQTANVDRVIIKGSPIYVTLYPDDQKIHITNITATLDGKNVDILTGYKYFKSNVDGTKGADDNSNVKTFSIKVEASASDTINKYQLIQGGQVVVESRSNQIDLSVFTGTTSKPTSYGVEKNWRIDKLKAGKNVYLRLVDVSGVVSGQKLLGIKVSEPFSGQITGGDDEKGEISLGDEFKMKIPGDIPLISGSEISLGWKNPLPFNLTVDESGKIRMAVNVKLGNYTHGSVDKTDLSYWDEIEKDFKKAMEDVAFGRASASKAFGGDPQPFNATLIQGGVSVMGYGEGYRDENGNAIVTLGFLVSGKIETSKTWQHFIWTIPVYVTLGGKVDASFGGDFYITNSNNQWHYTGANVEMKFTPAFVPSGGVGVNGVLSGGVGGQLSIPVLWRFSDDYKQIKLSANVFLEYTAFLLSGKSDPIIEGEWVIYDSFNRSTTASTYSEAINSIYDSSEYAPMSRKYLNSPMLLADEHGIVQNNVYPFADPKLVKVGTTNYLFWLQDIDGRADNDRTALVFSTSIDLETWTDPKQVIPDSDGNGTADYAYDLCVDGANIHIVLCKANKTYGGNADIGLDDVAKSTEIFYTKVDTSDSNKTDSPVQLTNDNCADLIPAITMGTNGKPIVAFAKNSMSNSFFESNTYTLNYVTIPTTEGNPVITSVNVSGSITELTAGSLGNGAAIAYVLDEDGDYTTDEDREVHALTPDSGSISTKLTNNEVPEFSPTFASVDGDGALFWYEDGNIKYVDNATATAKNVFEADSLPTNLNNNFYMVGEQLLWSTVVPNGSDEDLYDNTTAVYATEYSDGSWSSPYLLFTSDSQMPSVISGYALENESILAYLERLNVASENSTTNLRVRASVKSPDLELLGVYYDMSSVVPGQPIPLELDVRNNGGADISSFTVAVADSTPQKIDETVSSGEEKSITVNWTVPMNLNGKTDFEVTVSTDGDLMINNNSETYSIGYTDVSVTAQRVLLDDRDWASIVISNESSQPTDVILRLIADETNGAVLYEETYNNISNSNTKSLLIDLAQLGGGTNIDVIYAKVIAKKDEIATSDNQALLYMGMGKEIQYMLNVEATGGTITAGTGGMYNEGDEVEISAQADPGYTFTGWTSSNGGTFGDSKAMSTTFTMPASDTTVTATFKLNSGGSGGGYYPPAISFYSIKVNQSEHGVVTATPTSVYAGGTVTLTVMPDKNYKLDKLTVTDSQNHAIEVTEKNGKYTFKMPSRNVTVSAVFVPVQSETPSPWENPFPDVKNGAWYWSAVKYASTEGLMNGYKNGKFGPNDTITRAEFAQIIYNKEGRPNTGGDKFTDVKSGQWYANAVNWAAEAGVVSGIGSGKYAPNEPITREQLATMLWRYAGSPTPAKTDLAFKDANKVSGYAKDALCWASENGIVNGKGNGILDPRGTATRAETAQMLMNYLKK